MTCVGKAKGTLEVHGREWVGKTQSEPTLRALGGVRVLIWENHKDNVCHESINRLITNDVTMLIRSFFGS